MEVKYKELTFLIYSSLPTPTKSSISYITMPPNTSLTPFFSPRGVAVIGASQNPNKLGYGLARNLVQSNYQGAVHFVNPKGGILFGSEMHTGVGHVPDPVDLAVILIPAPSVPEALRECGQRGLKAVIIGSGGFRETGPAGQKLEDECLQIARTFQMRLLGPNSIGLLDTHFPLDATFLPPPGPLAGDVAFISHSGAICAAVIDWARGQGFGLSRLISLGNQADVNETDLLAPVGEDPFSKVLTLYLEGVSDGARFTREAQRLSQRKPVIALKVGRFKSGQRAIASHTGALAGQEIAYDAAFRRAGVIRADTSEEMFDWARALAWCPPPEGHSTAVLTNAGGPGAAAADRLEAAGMSLAKLTTDTLDALRSSLPPEASLSNPVDMLASASPEHYAACLRILLDDPGVHSILVILPPPPMYTAGAVAKAIIPVIHRTDKPVVIALMGERLIQEAVEHFRAARIPEYRFPERAASALSILSQRADYLQRADQNPVTYDDIDQARASKIVESFRKWGARVFLPQGTANELLQAYGISTLPIETADTPETAVTKARMIGYPVALKIDSPDIAHKSDVKGVLLDLKDNRDVLEGFRQLVSNARESRPNAVVRGVYVQPMAPQGQEVIVGGLQDPQFGPLVMFGSGGIEVEGLNDVAFAMAPMTDLEAEYVLGNTWAGRRLRGYRDLPPADRAALKQVLQRLAQLIADLPHIAEIEINPLVVLNPGVGCLPVDIRVKIF
jgi:acetyltransferase